jgi:hypothetical protein
MPRILPREMARSAHVHPLLGKLMGVCRSVAVAKRELRWLEDEILRLDEKEARQVLRKYGFRVGLGATRLTRCGQRQKWERQLLQTFVVARSLGIPLQLIVGRPFHMEVVIHRKSAVWTSQSSFAPRSFHSAVRDGGMVTGASESAAKIGSCTTCLYSRGSMFWHGLHTAAAPEIYIFQHQCESSLKLRQAQ